MKEVTTCDNVEACEYIRTPTAVAVLHIHRDTMAPIPYQIAVPESRLEDLRKRLDLATFPDELEDAEWAYGSPLADVKRLTSYWRNTFDWRKAEAKLNELPNFKANVTIDGFGETELHFLHQPSPAQDAVPLLFVHGWPGSYIEVTKMLSSLAGDANGVKFHVVAPSLPNYAWSAGIKKKGFGLGQYAEACHRLMQLLGYKRYDWGMYITRSIGLLYPESCLASHINMVRAFPPEWSESPLLALQHAVTPYTEDEQKGRERSDCYPWSDDEILTWISIYWFSQAGPAASLRIYYEATHTSAEATRERVQHWIGGVKLGLCYAPKELTIVPRTWGRTLGPVVFESEKRCGGHFLAYEQPEEVVSDLRAMFGTSGACQDILKS
ncbi:alpha/beta-hydrolase [Aureobasidium pullulans]|nr:alpha/beta-hydrolase [Aureobasidium pullulans]